MSTDFIVALSAPARPIPELLEALEISLVERAGMQHDGTILRCAWQPDTNTWDEVSPEEELGPSRLSDLATAASSWMGFSSEWWNDSIQVYVLVARVDRADSEYVDAWVTISTNGLQRLAQDGKVNAFYAAVAQIAAAIGATAGYGHFEVAYEPLPPARAEAAIYDLPDYRGKAASLGLLPFTHGEIKQLRSQHGAAFHIVGTTAGYWVLANRALDAFWQA